MLTVESVVPGGPADGRLEPGDVLVRLGGAVVAGFLPMEAALDDAVGRRVAVCVERGGVPLAFDIEARRPAGLASPCRPPPPVGLPLCEFIRRTAVR